MTPEYTQLMAHYNQWMNQRMYEAASRLGADLLMKDQGAFFGSVFGTLQHIAVADTIWLLRFATHPAGFASLRPLQNGPKPTALNQPLFANWADLLAYRLQLDATLVAFRATAALHEHGRGEAMQGVCPAGDPLFQPPNPPPGSSQHLAPPNGRGSGGDRFAGPHSRLAGLNPSREMPLGVAHQRTLITLPRFTA